MMLNRVKKHTRCDPLQFAQELAQTICQARLEKPLFEICLFYMGIAQIALVPSPPSVKRANVEKSAPNHADKPLQPKANVGKKVPQTILASLYIPPP